MKITKATSEVLQPTAAADATGDVDVTIVAPSSGDQSILEVIADSYVTIVVVAVVILVLVVGLAVYKSCTTWASTRTSRRRRHSSQQQWLPEDNPEMWADGDGELTTSSPSVPSCCRSKGSAPYWSNPAFLISDIRALLRSGLSARAPECQKLKMLG